MQIRLRYIVFTIILITACTISIYLIKHRHKTDVEPWVFRKVFDVNIEALSRMKEHSEENEKNFSMIVKYADATHRFLRMPEGRTSICFTDWGNVWRVLYAIKNGPNTDREVQNDSEMIRYYSTDHLIEDLKLDKNMTGESFIFIKKEPLERAIDEFMQTCIEDKHPCFGCGYDFICHLEKVHLHLKIVGADNSTMHPDYIRYIPFNWFCEMEKMRNRFIIMDETIIKGRTYERAYSYLVELSNDEKDEITMKNSMKTKSFLIDMVTTNRYLLDLFLATYHWDYVIFNYTIPELKDY